VTRFIIFHWSATVGASWKEEQQRSARKTRQSEECKGNRFTRILLTTTMVTTARASTTQWGQKLHKKAKFPYTACILTKYFLNILVLHIFKA
jgi:hypothetical protein